MNGFMTGLQRASFVVVVLVAFVLLLLWGAMSLLRALFLRDTHVSPSFPDDDSTGGATSAGPREASTQQGKRQWL